MVDDPVVGGVRYVPYNVDVALAFIDISGYSKLTAALKSKGAHALAAAVNGYFERMITCVSAHHGTVLKFAGDALMVAFIADDTVVSAQRSVQCCTVLQAEHGEHIVEEANSTTLRIHVGVAAGMLTNLVLQPHTRAAKVMPGAFHYVGGEVLRDVADVVDGSAAGEVCITPAVAERCGASSIVTEKREENVLLLKSFTMPEIGRDAPDFMEHSDGEFESDDDMSKSTSLAPSQSMYGTGGGVATVEDLFMPPAILGKLKGGLRTKDIAEMRSLVVLFIKKTGIASVSEWFEELHEVLAANRCPVTQIIDDDKGVHVVAAVNLYVVEEGACDSVFTIAREITARRLGCTVGIASGPCFAVSSAVRKRAVGM
jgi:class 3 adenylate cyclase